VHGVQDIFVYIFSVLQDGNKADQTFVLYCYRFMSSG